MPDEQPSSWSKQLAWTTLSYGKGSGFLSETLTELTFTIANMFTVRLEKIRVEMWGGTQHINLNGAAGVDVTFLRIVLIALVALSIGNAIIVFVLL